MAPRGRKRGDDDESSALTKEDEAIAKHVRFNCPTETTLVEGNEVHYFTGSKAVDTLYDSSYGSKAKKDPRFSSRAAAADFMQSLLDMQLIWRARKLVAKKKEDKKDTKAGGDVTKSPKTDSPKPKKDKKNKEVEETDNEKKEEKEEKDDGKKKRKVKLEVHTGQYFNDSNDVYVWVYDPTPLYKKVIGLLMVVGTIVGCLFPLWPMWMRQGVYYLSIAGISVFGVIIAVAILRTILFGIIWAATMGEHKLWVLPNLTEDVGFFESFQPWYTYERASEEEAKKKAKKDAKKKAKDSDAEEDKQKGDEEEQKEDEKDDEGEGEDHSQNSSAASSASEGSQMSDQEEQSGARGAETRARRRPKKDHGGYVMVDK